MTDSKEDGLLACPFCGAHLQRQQTSSGHWHEHMGEVEDCYATGSIVFDENIAAWNRRASSPPVRGSGEVVGYRWRYKAGDESGSEWLVTADDPRADASPTRLSRLGEVIPLYAAPVPNGVPEGWKLVPIEPTLAMSFAGETEYTSKGLGVWSDFHAIYRAMIAASPVTPEGLSGGDGWIEWKGRGRPAFDDDRVFIRQRGGSEFAVLAGTVKWSHDGRAHDIIAYRLAKTV